MLGDGPKLGFQEPGIGRPGLAVGPGLVEGTPTWHCPVFGKATVQCPAFLAVQCSVAFLSVVFLFNRLLIRLRYSGFANTAD